MIFLFSGPSSAGNVTEMQWRLFDEMVATSWDDSPILVRDHQRSEEDEEGSQQGDSQEHAISISSEGEQSSHQQTATSSAELQSCEVTSSRDRLRKGQRSKLEPGQSSKGRERAEGSRNIFSDGEYSVSDSDSSRRKRRSGSKSEKVSEKKSVVPKSDHKKKRQSMPDYMRFVHSFHKAHHCLL